MKATLVRNELHLSDFCNKSSEFTVVVTEVNLGKCTAVAVNLNGTAFTFHNSLTDALTYVRQNVLMAPKEVMQIVEAMS